MPAIEQIPRFAAASGFIRFCFYFIGIFLVGGGCQKLYRQYGRSRRPHDAENDA
jgi:hypothetical protein